MATTAKDPKDPDEVVDYPFNWTSRLAGSDTLVSSTFFVEEGSVEIDSMALATPIATVWLSGGTLDETCLITNRVITSGGRTYDWTMKLKIKAK